MVDMLFLARIAISEFLEWLNSNYLLYLSTRGASFTWSNGRRGSCHTKKHLDKVVCNTSRLIVGCLLINSNSDHYPLLLDFQHNEIGYVSSFRYLNMWASHNDCFNVVKDSWNTNIVGCPMFILTENLNLLKNNLKDWNKNILVMCICQSSCIEYGICPKSNFYHWFFGFTYGPRETCSN